eukprot:TRINITY_DN9018_c0_g1_i1.p1 TRINITY_DN9018_c0_g1~~TRINITY_DN9018_c0_g1_i1.p1  ORF type:complete len:136 (+),score=25.84 TRINITY_DN9018_c0_g1_i1:96-503(+)
MLKTGLVTPDVLINAALNRVAKTEDQIFATIELCEAEARKVAANLRHPDPVPPGYLYGLPIFVKDLQAVKNVRYTKGSLHYADNIASKNDPIVQVLVDNGAIVLGKTNTPRWEQVHKLSITFQLRVTLAKNHTPL